MKFADDPREMKGDVPTRIDEQTGEMQTDAPEFENKMGRQRVRHMLLELLKGVFSGRANRSNG
jgi:hypothetical protein